MGASDGKGWISILTAARGNTCGLQGEDQSVQERFEPESKKELYREELQTHIKKRNED